MKVNMINFFKLIKIYQLRKYLLLKARKKMMIHILNMPNKL